MSQQQQAMSLQEALSQLAVLEDYINRLQAALADIERRIVVLAGAEEALQNISKDSHLLASLDGTGTVYAHVKVENADRVIIHVGLDIYVEVPREKALELLREERASLARVADAYRRELAAATQYYASLRAAVENVIARARQASSSS